MSSRRNGKNIRKSFWLFFWGDRMNTNNYRVEVNNILGEIVLGGYFNLNEGVHFLEIALQHSRDWVSNIIFFEKEVLFRIIRHDLWAWACMEDNIDASVNKMSGKLTHWIG